MADDDKKKKKEPGVIERIKQGIGAGKALYGAYMARRKRMAETMPTGPETRKVGPGTTPPEKEPQVAQPPKKKKKRGGVGAVMDTIQERKRRMAEALDMPEKEEETE